MYVIPFHKQLEFMKGHCSNASNQKRASGVTVTGQCHRDMCILVICVFPPIWLPVICVSSTPSPPNKCLFCFCHFLFLQNICIIPCRLKETKGTRFLSQENKGMIIRTTYTNEPTSQQNSQSRLRGPHCGQHSHPFVSI